MQNIIVIAVNLKDDNFDCHVFEMTIKIFHMNISCALTRRFFLCEAVVALAARWYKQVNEFRNNAAIIIMYLVLIHYLEVGKFIDKTHPLLRNV